MSAVVLGAKVIEKYIILDRNMEVPNHKASIEFDGFKNMLNI